MADKQKYQVNAPVYGDLAYDLDVLVRERELEQAGIQEERQEYVRPRKRPQAAVRPRERVALLPVVGVLMLAVMAIGLVMGYVQLSRISASVSEIKSELAQLDVEHVSLLTQYEQTYDLATVKERAEKAGMSKPSITQIEYIDLGASDAATVYRAENDGVVGNVMKSVKQGWQTLVEYFT